MPTFDRENKIRAIVRQVVLTYILQAVTLVSGLWLSREVVNESGAAAFGFLALIGPLNAFLGLLDGGISGACVREMIAALGAGESARYAELLHVTRRWLHFLGALVAGAFFLLGITIHHWVDLQDLPVEQARLAVWLTGAQQVAVILLRIPSIVLTTHQRQDLLSLFNLLAHLPSALVSIFLLHQGYGIVGVAISQFIFALFGQAYAWWTVRSRFPQVKPSERRPEWSTVRSIFAFSGWLFAEQVAMVIYFQTAILLSSSMLGLGAAAVLAAVMRPANTLQGVLFSLTNPLFHYAAELGGGRRIEESARLHLLGCRISSALGFPSGIALVCYTGPFVALWLKPDLAGSHVLICVIALQMTAQVFWHTTGSMIAGYGRDVAIRHAQVVIIGAGLTLLLSILGIPWLGNSGAILAAILAAAFTSGWWLPRAAAQAFGHTVSDYWAESLWRPLPSVLPFLMIALPIRLLLPLNTWPWLVLQLAVGALCVVSGGLFLGVSMVTRQALIRRVLQVILPARYAPFINTRVS